jgi:hypothetical protein
LKGKIDIERVHWLLKHALIAEQQREHEKELLSRAKSREKLFFSIIISISSHRRRIGQSELTGAGGGGETWQKNAN